MDEIVKMAADKTGISHSQATTAVNLVLGFVKDKLPEGVSGQLDSFLDGKAGSSDVGGIADSIKGMFGK